MVEAVQASKSKGAEEAATSAAMVDAAALFKDFEAKASEVRLDEFAPLWCEVQGKNGAIVRVLVNLDLALEVVDGCKRLEASFNISEYARLLVLMLKSLYNQLHDTYKAKARSLRSYITEYNDTLAKLCEPADLSEIYKYSSEKYIIRDQEELIEKYSRKLDELENDIERLSKETTSLTMILAEISRAINALQEAVRQW